MPCSAIEFSSIHVGFVWLALGFAELAFPPPWKFCQNKQFLLAGGFWFWAKLKITASAIENCTLNKKKTHPNQPIGTEGRFPRTAWQLELRSGNLRDMGLQGGVLAALRRSR